MPKQEQTVANEDRSGVVDPQHQKTGRNKVADTHNPAEAFTSLIGSTTKNENAVEATIDMLEEVASRLRSMPLNEEAREHLAVDIEHNAEELAKAVVANTDARNTTRVVGRNKPVNR